MIECFIYLIVWCIAAVLFIFLFEYLIGLFISLPSQVFALIRNTGRAVGPADVHSVHGVR